MFYFIFKTFIFIIIALILFVIYLVIKEERKRKVLKEDTKVKKEEVEQDDWTNF